MGSAGISFVCLLFKNIIFRIPLKAFSDKLHSIKHKYQGEMETYSASPEEVKWVQMSWDLGRLNMSWADIWLNVSWLGFGLQFLVQLKKRSGKKSLVQTCWILHNGDKSKFLDINDVDNFLSYLRETSLSSS